MKRVEGFPLSDLGRLGRRGLRAVASVARRFEEPPEVSPAGRPHGVTGAGTTAEPGAPGAASPDANPVGGPDERRTLGSTADAGQLAAAGPAASPPAGSGGWAAAGPARPAGGVPGVGTPSELAEPSTPAGLIAGHLGGPALSLPVVGKGWPAYERVNLQAGLDAWLAAAGREHRLVGLSPSRQGVLSLGDLAQADDDRAGGARLGSVSLVQLPAGPDGELRTCVRRGLYLLTDRDGYRSVLLLGEGEEPDGCGHAAQVQVVGPDPGRSAATLAELGELAARRNVYRGQVITFRPDALGGRGASAAPGFERRPSVERESLVLPDGVLELIERQVLGVARHGARLRASRQHLRRGLLLYGPPGTGKTHTVRYLLGRLSGVTVVVLSGDTLGSISAACALARRLQPAAVVVEDVDLIAEHRDRHPGGQPLLFQLLNEMDGLGEDVDVAFVLTTNRPDLLEPALAARPGRVDQAVELPLPDAPARRRLLECYRGDLLIEAGDLDAVVARTEGVTASFMKEVLRRAALLAAEGAQSEEARGLQVTGGHLGDALDELLDDRARLNEAVLDRGSGAGVP